MSSVTWSPASSAVADREEKTGQKE
jgi:hypothetical protein